MATFKSISPRKQIVDLPVELLLEILGHVDYRSLLRVATVCRSLYTLISTSAQLQYIIELGADGLIDTASGADAQPTYPERLKLLLERRKGWSRLRWRQKSSVPMPGQCQAYELVGGVFAKTMHYRHLTAAWLPSVEASGHSLDREDVGIPTRDFAIDPTQDLIAYVEDSFIVPATHFVQIHLRTLTTNDTHPDAQAPLLRINTTGMLVGAFVQIVDDVIGMFLLTPEARVIIWNWKSSKLLVDRCDLGKTIEDFSFMSNCVYCVLSNNGSGSIHLYQIPTTPAELPAEPLAILQLPPIRDVTMIEHMGIHTGPFNAHPPPGKHFTTAPDARIHVLTIRYMPLRRTPPLPNFCLYVHNETLLRYAVPGMGRVPWETWGPDNTRLLPQEGMFNWLRYVQGYRVVYPPLFLETRQHVVQLIDFNPHAQHTHTSFGSSALAPGVSTSTTDEGGAGIGSDIWEYTHSVSPPETCVKKPEVFDGDVVTRLPYMLASREVGRGYSGFMIDEERLVGLKTDAIANGDMGEIHVFTF